MRNIKIAGKLIIGFGAVLLFLMINVILAALGLTSVAGNFTSFHDEAYLNTREIDGAELDLQEAAKNIAVSILEDDMSDIQSRLGTVEELFADIDERFTYLKANYDGDMNDIHEVEEQAIVIRSVYEELKPLLISGQDTEAYALFEEKIIPAFLTMREDIDTVSEFLGTQATTSYAEAQRSINSTIIFMVILGVIAVIIGVLFALYITSSITKGVREIEAATHELVRGNFHSTVNYVGKDEIGSLANGVREVCTCLNAVISDIDMVLKEAAHGNFQVKSGDDSIYVGALSGIHDSMLYFIAKMNEAMTKINTASEQVAAGSDQVSSGAQALSQGAMEQASSVEELAATITAISSKITANADDAAHASERTNDAGTEMRTAANKMNQLVSAMNEIQNSSSETKKIIKTIEDIAFQTNILALNAAVEAARAGAAGKGFAVVADEVRNLAGKSAEAAKNTTNLIEGTVAAIDKGNALVEEVAQEIGAVSKATDEVAVLNEKISGAAKEAADSITQVTVGIDQISGVVQTNSATSEESAAASEELSGQAQLLKDLVSEFKLTDVD